MNEEKEGRRAEDVAKKYNINLKKLEEEQIKLSRQLVLKDSIDFSGVEKVGGFSNVFHKNKIISTVVVISSSLEIIEQKYFSDKVKFPYIPGFRAYRELPAMVSCFNSLEEKPQLVFILGHGTSHPRLGIASHFSLATGVPSIGISDSLAVGEVRGEDVVLNGKVVGKVLRVKSGARELYVSPGNMISIKTAYELAKKFVKLPHKLPEPLHIAHKYAKEIMSENIN